MDYLLWAWACFESRKIKNSSEFGGRRIFLLYFNHFLPNFVKAEFNVFTLHYLREVPSSSERWQNNSELISSHLLNFNSALPPKFQEHLFRGFNLFMIFSERQEWLIFILARSFSCNTGKLSPSMGRKMKGKFPPKTSESSWGHSVTIQLSRNSRSFDEKCISLFYVCSFFIYSITQVFNICSRIWSMK